MKQKCCKFIALLFLLSQLVFQAACQTLFVKDPQKAVRKQQETDIRKTQKSYNEALKEHYSHQDKKTKKRMRKKYKTLQKQSKKKK